MWPTREHLYIDDIQIQIRFSLLSYGEYWILNGDKECVNYEHASALQSLILEIHFRLRRRFTNIPRNVQKNCLNHPKIVGSCTIESNTNCSFTK